MLHVHRAVARAYGEVGAAAARGAEDCLRGQVAAAVGAGRHAVLLSAPAGCLTPTKMLEFCRDFADMATMEASNHLIRRQLGTILIEEGFLTPEQLERAIAERALEPEQPLPRLRVAGDSERRRLVGELEALREQCRTLGQAVSLLESELERVRDSI